MEKQIVLEKGINVSIIEKELTDGSMVYRVRENGDFSCYLNCYSLEQANEIFVALEKPYKH